MSETAKKSKPGLGIVGPCRLSYLNCFRPRLNKLRGEEQYSVTIMVPKTSNSYCPDPQAVKQRIEDLIQEALLEEFGKAPPKWENPFGDGDVDTDSSGNPKFPGYWFVSASAKKDYPPSTFDPSGEETIDGWQSGDWGKVKMSFYGYEFQGKKGVGVGFRAIKFLAHDEPLGGGATSAKEFDDDPGFDPFADGE